MSTDAVVAALKNHGSEMQQRVTGPREVRQNMIAKLAFVL